jgi:hypothetical protein
MKGICNSILNKKACMDALCTPNGKALTMEWIGCTLNGKAISMEKIGTHVFCL